MKRPWVATGWIALLAIAGLLPMQSAWGHVQFTGSDPASDATIENSPHEIVLTFSQAVTPVTVTLVGPDDAIVETVGDAVANGERIVLPVTAPLTDGTHVVSFRVLSGDAHPISGGFRFTLTLPSTLSQADAPEAGSTPIAKPVTSAPSIPAAADPMPSDLGEKALRVAFIATLLLAVGLVLFRLTIALPEPLEAWVVTLTRRAGSIGLVVVVAYFLVAVFTVTGVGGFRPRHLYVVLQTSIGMSLLVAVLGFLFLSMSGKDERIASGIGAAVLVVSRVLTGHPISQDPTLLLVPAMALHVAAAAFWFASLWVLLRFLRKGPLADAPQLLGAFAHRALWSVGALLVAGLVMAIVHVNSVDALLQSGYGQTLLWKLGGVAGLLLLAAINKLVLTPDLLQRFEARRLKASIRIEALLMIVVISVSTVLAATAPVARAELPVTQAESARISVPSDTGTYTLQVTFSSAPYDETQPLFAELFDARGNPFTPLELSMTVTIPSRRIEALPLNILSAQGNHVVIEADFPDTADTRFAAQVLVTEFDRERFAFSRESSLEQ